MAVFHVSTFFAIVICSVDYDLKQLNFTNESYGVFAYILEAHAVSPCDFQKAEKSCEYIDCINFIKYTGFVERVDISVNIFICKAVGFKAFGSLFIKNKNS